MGGEVLGNDINIPKINMYLQTGTAILVNCKIKACFELLHNQHEEALLSK